MKKPSIVIKIGTQSIADGSNDVRFDIIQSIAEESSALLKEYNVIIVSSGSIGLGRKYISSKKTYSILEKKAAAAVGNRLLSDKYGQAFSFYGITVAQMLFEREHFSDRERFLSLRETIYKVWENNIIPIVNENDVVSSYEINFSDNDELAMLLATSLGAKKLLLGTCVKGLLDKSDKIIKEITKFDKKIFSYIQSDWSDLGSGGMGSKLRSAHIATELGVETCIFDIQKPGNIKKAINKEIGTTCLAKEVSHSSTKKWIANAAKIAGNIIVDEGCYRALKKGKSLLLIGVIEIQGFFEIGEVFAIITHQQKHPIGFGRSKYSSKDIKNQKEKKGIIVAHADAVIIFS